MRESLRAWVQDPDDWKLKHYTPMPKRPSIYKRITNWFRNLIFNTWMGFLIILVLLSSLGCLIAGPS